MGRRGAGSCSRPWLLLFRAQSWTHTFPETAEEAGGARVTEPGPARVLSLGRLRTSTRGRARPVWPRGDLVTALPTALLDSDALRLFMSWIFSFQSTVCISEGAAGPGRASLPEQAELPKVA